MIEIHQPLPPNTFLWQQTTASTAAPLIRDSPQAGCHPEQCWNGEKIIIIIILKKEEEVGFYQIKKNKFAGAFFYLS